MSVIVDQSPTVSDIGALGFLAARSDVELLAVTMPGTGESDCAPGAVTTRAVLDAAGQIDVPIGCGGAPLDGSTSGRRSGMTPPTRSPRSWHRAQPRPTYYDAESVLLEEIARRP